jgi:hypothetical protein
MRKKILVLAMGIAGLFAGNSYAGGTDPGVTMNQEEILKRLDSLQKTVASQQELINDLRKQVDQNKVMVENVNSEAQPSSIALANKAIDQLKIKGDLRVRFETRNVEHDGGDENRDRFRTRFRVGGVWKNKAENWEVGAGLATGGTSATSTNDTWSESSPFETGDIRLDYAYGKHKWNDFTFTAGQHKNPWKRSWIIFDSDIRFAGFTGNYTSDIGFFVTAGAYGAKYYKASGDDYNTAMLYAGQLGYGGKVGDVKYTLTAGYHTYDSSFISDEYENGDLENVDPDKYELNIADIYGDLKFKLGKTKMKVYGNYWTNLDPDGEVGQGQLGGNIDPENEDIGYVLGLEAKIKKFKFQYAYAHVEADSLYGPLKDADFGTGINDTDVEGHKIGVSYSFTKNVSTSFTGMMYEPIEKDDEPDANLYQFDLKYKF